MLMMKRIVLIVLTLLLSCSLVNPQVRSADEVHPIFALKSDCLLGGTLKGKWLKTETVVSMLKGGEKYRVYKMTSATGDATGERPASMGVPCEDSFQIKFTPSMEGSESVLAIGGDWNALPRVPTLLSTSDAVYRKAVADLLRSKGITRPEVKIGRIVRVDLEGDGVDEVLVNATRYEGGLTPNSRRGDYSVVFLRKIIRGRVQTIVVDGEFYPRGKQFNAPNEYTLDGVLDVNGDGVMEIIVESKYYEGGATSVFRLIGNKVGAALVCGCGV